MALTSQQLTDAFELMSFGVAPTPLEQALINSYAAQTGLSGGLTDEQALLNTARLVGDTTAVAGLSYQFFTGGIPSEEGFYFLVNSEGNGDLNPNSNDLNDPYYETFNQENRYYNFALNLATGSGEGAADFAATYGALTMEEAVFIAYEEIVGTAAAIDAGINPDAARADIASREDFFRQVAIERGGLADTPANQDAIDLAAKALMVGYLLNEAFKASVGNLVTSFERFLLDVADDGADGTPPIFGDDVVEAYPGVDDALEFTLTPGADAGAAFTGGSGDDTYFGTEDTLTSTDILNGGEGDDTLIVATSGGADVVLAGFDTISIEEFQLTSDAGSTTLDVSGAEDLQRIINTNSSSDVTLTGMVPTIDVTFSDTTQDNGGGSVDLTIQYVASATAGDDDRQQITLANVIDPVFEVGQTEIDLVGNANGIEKVDLIVEGDNILTDLNSNGLDEVTVVSAPGDNNLTLLGVGFDTERPGEDTALLDASGLGGDLDVYLSTSDAVEIEVIGGEGDDRADFTLDFNGEDSFDGGDGDDLLEIDVDDLELFIADGTDTDLLDADEGEATNVETVTLMANGPSGALGSLDDTINLANLGAALTTLNVFTDISGDSTFANLLSTTEIVIDDDFADTNGETLTFDFVGDGATDELNLTILGIGGVDGSGDADVVIADDDLTDTLDDDSIDTFSLTVTEDAGGSTNELDIEFQSVDDMTTWNITGTGNVDAGAAAGNLASLVTVNGSTAAGDIDLNDVFFDAGSGVGVGVGITITTGSGNDDIGTGFGSNATDSLDGDDVISTGSGADEVWSGLGDDTVTLGAGADIAHGMQGNDTINGGDGDDNIWGNFGLDTLTGGAGADRFHYVNILDSQGTQVDIITDFVSGTDVIDLIEAVSAANPNAIVSQDIVFVGNATTFGNAVTALNATGGVEAVFVQDTNTLYVDVNGDGNIDTVADMAITLAGVTSITAADIEATFLPVSFTAITDNFDTSDPTDSAEGNVTSDAENDVVLTTIENLDGSFVDGMDAPQYDSLNISNQITYAVTLDDGGLGGTIVDIERLNLRQGSTAMVTGPSDAGMIISFGAATMFTMADGANDQTVSGSAQVDQITVEAENGVVNARAGNDTVTLNGGGNFGTFAGTSSLDGGNGTDTLELNGGSQIVGSATVDNFENTTIAANSTSIRLSASVHEELRLNTAVTATGAETLNIVGSGQLRGMTEIESYVLVDDPFTGGDDGTTFFFGTSTQNVDAQDGGLDQDVLVYDLGGSMGAAVVQSDSNDIFRLDFDTNVTAANFLNFNGTVLLNGPGTDITASDAQNWFGITGNSSGNSVILTNTGDTSVSLGVLTGINDVDATALADDDDVSLANLSNGLAVALGAADLFGAASTGGIIVSNGTSGATQEINTGIGDDTVSINGQATAHTINTNSGADTVSYSTRTTLLSTDLIDGGDGDDTLTVGGGVGAATDFNGVTNVENINDEVGLITSVDALIAAGENLDYTATGTGAVAIDFSLEADGSVDVVIDGTGGGTILATDNILVDTYTLNPDAAGAGVTLDFTLGAAAGGGNTLLNFTNVDVVNNMNPVIDSIATGTAGATVYTVTLGAGTTQANFAGGINTFIADNAIVGAAGDVYVVEVTGGALAGTYLVQDIDANVGVIGNDDFVIEVVGTVGGSITPADFI